MTEISPEPAAKGPLAGIRILDLTRVLAGPTATQLLGDLGADVIKIERPGLGDDTRAWGPPYVKDADGNDTSESAYYLCANRNKRSVAIDLAMPEGADLVRQLAGKCDVLVENFKVGGLAKFGLSFDDLSNDCPGLVYCSITGFGQTGPNAAKAGYDNTAQGYGGIMSLTGEPSGAPMKVAVGISDIMCGMYAATAVLAALRHRDLTGKGQHIDLALVDTQISWLVNEGTNYLLSGALPERRGNQHPNIVPYQLFEVAGGSIIIGVGNDHQFKNLCDSIGMPELATDPRYATNQARLAHRGRLIDLIACQLKPMRRDELLRDLDARGIPCGPVNTLNDVFQSEQVAARDMIVTMAHPKAGSGTVRLIGNPIKLSETPVSYRRPPPLAGQHTEEVLTELLGEDIAADACQGTNLKHHPFGKRNQDIKNP